MIERTKARAKAIARKFGNSYEQIQDIESNCLLAVLTAEDKIQAKSNPEAYIEILMRNEALDSINTERQPKTVPLNAYQGITYCSEDSLIDSIILHSKFKRLLSNISYPDTKIIECLLEGYSIKEIATELKTSANALRARICRQKPYWKTLLNEEEYN